MAGYDPYYYYHVRHVDLQIRLGAFPHIIHHQERAASARIMDYDFGRQIEYSERYRRQDEFRWKRHLPTRGLLNIHSTRCSMLTAPLVSHRRCYRYLESTSVVEGRGPILYHDANRSVDSIPR